jgi:hypothetical protein
MIELADTRPDVGVAPAEYNRLLGYPRGGTPDGRAAELADQARAWYAAHGRPWVYARHAETLEIGSSSLSIDGVAFTASRLRVMLQRAGAHSVILVAVGAGPELEADASRLWRDGKPDEYFFLDVYGSTLVEHLITTTGARLCTWAAQQGVTVLPHDSPGYPGWHVAEQPRLLDLLKHTRAHAWPCAVDALESGALRPTKSQLAVFGLTHHADRLRGLAGALPCEECSFEPCGYRRAPYRRRCQHPAADSLGSRDDVQT